MMKGSLILALVSLLCASVLNAQTGRSRALLIGINDYSASSLPAPERSAPPDRAWANLDGALNDVEMMRELLVALYGFQREDIAVLEDQQATREAILQALQKHLLAPAQKDDVVFFYFSGHGSQVRNSLSREEDRLDESLIPADSRLGANDIRDKELLPFFNGILDQGARLTIVLDACHSGSGARGLDGGMRYRAIRPDSRDVADARNPESPESRGALVLSAAQDFDLAFETLGDDGKIRGAFSWALARAMRDADPGEPASDTFLRARARLQAERPAQDPVFAANADARRNPLLGIRANRRNDREVIAIEKSLGPGTYLLQGGWASGVTVGSELRLVGRDDVRLEVASLSGVAHSTARVLSGAPLLHSGALLELVSWAAPPSPPLRVWIPRANFEVLPIARSLRKTAAKRRMRWIEDPTERTPAHLLRWRDQGWEVVAKGRRRKCGDGLLDGVRSRTSLFVHLPAHSQFIDAIFGESEISGTELTAGPETADYVLAGRFAHDRIEYAWVRPSASIRDHARSVLPLRTAWTDDAVSLRENLVRLRRVQAWHGLPSPSAFRSHYRLAVRHLDGGQFVENGKLVGGVRYGLVLRQRESSRAEPVYSRYVYVFAIDSNGKSVLLYPSPERGSVENLLPFTTTPGEPLRRPPVEIPLIGTRRFVVAEPYGIDTYFLLFTDEQLPNLASLQWLGVRAPHMSARYSPLEELLASTLAGTRGSDPIRTTPNWSIDKVVFESVPRKRSAR